MRLSTLTNHRQQKKTESIKYQRQKESPALFQKEPLPGEKGDPLQRSPPESSLGPPEAVGSSRKMVDETVKKFLISKKDELKATEPDKQREL